MHKTHTTLRLVASRRLIATITVVASTIISVAIVATSRVAQAHVAIKIAVVRGATVVVVLVPSHRHWHQNVHPAVLEPAVCKAKLRQ